jgi:hypothetical protein
MFVRVTAEPSARRVFAFSKGLRSPKLHAPFLLVSGGCG